MWPRRYLALSLRWPDGKGKGKAYSSWLCGIAKQRQALAYCTKYQISKIKDLGKSMGFAVFDGHEEMLKIGYWMYMTGFQERYSA
jgi:hypothetical protein